MFKSETSEHQACELLCLLQLCRLTDENRERCKYLSTQLSLSDAWNWFFHLAQSNSAIILTSDRLKELGIAQPENFQAFALKIRKQSSERAAHAHRILDAASNAGIEVIVLKGALFGSVLYRDPGYKKMNDIDILVHFDQAQAMVGVLKKLGLMSVGDLFDQKEVSEKSHHSPPFVTSDMKCMVGLHWGLNSPDTRWKPSYGMIWKQKQPVKVFDADAFRMSWEENLLHLCIHLPFFKIGVRELADVYNLILFSEPRLDWNLFNGLVQLWKAEDAAWRVLSLTSALQKIEVSQQLFNQWRPKALPFTVKDTENRLKLGNTLIATRSVHIGKIEKAFVVFKLSPAFSQRFKAWGMTWVLTFWPKRAELGPITGVLSFPRFSDLLKARLQSLTYCWRALARDYGNIPLITITIINILSITKSLVLWPIRRFFTPVRKNADFKILEMLE